MQLAKKGMGYYNGQRPWIYKPNVLMVKINTKVLALEKSVLLQTRKCNQ